MAPGRIEVMPVPVFEPTVPSRWPEIKKSGKERIGLARMSMGTLKHMLFGSYLWVRIKSKEKLRAHTALSNL